MDSPDTQEPNLTNTAEVFYPEEVKWILSLLTKFSCPTGVDTSGTKLSLGTSSTNERELISLLANRLMVAETQLSYARQTIRQREFHITVLEEKLR